jgi:hypothetical protein
MSDTSIYTPARTPGESITEFEVQTFLRQAAHEYQDDGIHRKPTPVRTVVMQYYPVGGAFRRHLFWVFPAKAGWVVDSSGIRSLTEAEVVAWSRRAWPVVSGPLSVMEAQERLRREWRNRHMHDMDVYTANQTMETDFASVIGTNHIYVERYFAPMAAYGATICVDVEGNHRQVARHWRT